MAAILNGQRMVLTSRDRSMHQLFIGGTGTGKTTAMELQIRQDIVAGRGVALIDPMGALYDRTLAFCAYRKAIGCRVPEIVLCNPSAGEWVLPYNPFLRHDGDISVQVDRRVQATLRAWGQHSGDETPRLEKWLKCLYTVLVECNLTILEAAFLLDQQAHDVRTTLMTGLTDPFIRNKMEQLSRYRAGEFLEQVESVENRLMRFLCSRTMRTMMGTGINGLDFGSAMDEGHIVLVNLAPSRHFSREQQRLVGTLILTEFYETALTRQSGSRPFYFFIDEAARFVAPELGEALEQCRQKGLHFSLAFQHLEQFRQEDPRLYKAVKNNTRTKLVFAVPDREDAQELADDLFVGLAEPQIKIMHRHLSHLIEDIRQASKTTSVGNSESFGRGDSNSESRSHSAGRNWTATSAQSRGFHESAGSSFAISEATSHQRSSGRSHSVSESESNTWGYAETESESTAESRSQSQGSSRSQGVSESESSSSTTTRLPDGEITGASTGTAVDASRTSTVASSDSQTSAQAHTTGMARTHSSQETVGRSVANGTSTSVATGKTKGRSFSNSTQRGNDRSVSRSSGFGGDESQSEGRSRTRSRSQEQGHSQSTSVTDQPGVRHTPFYEEDPEHWTLEDQRWRASELVMGQQTGQCLIRTPSGKFGAATIPLPRKFYISPQLMLRFSQQFYQRCCLTPEQADQHIATRQRALLFQSDENNSDAPTPFVPISPEAVLTSGPATQPNESLPDETKSQPIWNRERGGAPTNSPKQSHGKRGPKADIENHLKTAKIIAKYGKQWMTGDNLREVCAELDQQGVPVPRNWATRSDGRSRSWGRGYENYRNLVVKAIKDKLKGAAQLELPLDEQPPQVSAAD